MALLPTDAAERKKIPIGTGVLDYFPDALAEVAKASVAGNKQHLNGGSLRWDRAKSTDESDALIRHFLERDKMDEDGVLHAGKMAWRALSYTQKLIEARRANEKKPELSSRTSVACISPDTKILCSDGNLGTVARCSCYPSISDPAGVVPNPLCLIHGE